MIPPSFPLIFCTLVAYLAFLLTDGVMRLVWLSVELLSFTALVVMGVVTLVDWWRQR